MTPTQDPCNAGSQVHHRSPGPLPLRRGVLLCSDLRDQCLVLGLHLPEILEDPLDVVFRYALEQLGGLALKIACLALFPADARNDVDEVVKLCSKIAEVAVRLHHRRVLFRLVGLDEDLLVGKNLGALQPFTDGVDILLHLPHILDDLVDLGLLLGNRVDDIHDTVRVEVPVYVLWHFLELVLEELGALVLVAHLMRHLLHLAATALHLVDHALAPLLARGRFVFVRAQLLDQRLTVAFPLLPEFHQVTCRLRADLLQLHDVLRSVGKHLEGVSLDLVLLLQRVRRRPERGQVGLDLARLRRQDF
mmetsp:Transcript_11826/g.27408  ORF Transcript_11826/g.27408 Transcript_11826/m.27408 type:complete len:305 (+) Transcript_11826:120-1034(+)